METFGRYQLQATLGQGGMGIVYRAFDTVLERVVALKLVLTPDGLDPEMRERFFREARAAGQLSHKNVVTIYDMGEHDGRPFLAMEYLDGEDLQRRLERPEKMSFRHKLNVAIEICHGVEYAHSHGIVHRDIKPANIYITDDGTVKILDFGLARLMTSQLTRSNMLMGTLNYMAPEQVRGERADQRSDIFSVGVVLYELFGGRKAFEGDSVASTLYKILQEVPEPLWKLDASLPHELTTIIDRAMAKLRDERYPDMAGLRTDLEAHRQDHHPTGRLTPSPVRASVPPTVIATRSTLEEIPAAPASVGSVPDRDSAARLPGAPRAPRSWRRLARATGAVLLATAAFAWFVAHRAHQPSSPVTPAVVERPADPMASRLRAAQEALDGHGYGAAISGAEAVLLLEPQNTAAERIRAAARQGAVEDALRRGSDHLKKGETSEAIKAAGEALALAPDNADARGILEQAGRRTSGADAETARGRMTEGRAAADAAGASTRAASAFNKASRAAQGADRLYQARRFAEAASRYYEASGLYHAAELAARSSAPAPDTAAPGPTSAPRPQPEPRSPFSPATVAAPVPPAAPPTAPSVAAPASTPASEPAPAPAPTAAAPSAVAPVPPTASEPAAPALPDDRTRITNLIDRYKQALESRSFEQLKGLWPSLGGTAESAIRQEFQHAARITVEVEALQISVSGGAGTASFIRKYGLVTVEGQRLQSTSQAVMDVRRTASGWVIDAIHFTPR